MRRKVLVVLSIIAWSLIILAVWRSLLVNAAQDPNLCQYPTRPLVDGHCDNTDPADPQATVKGEPLVQPTILETPVTNTVQNTSGWGK